MKYDHQKFCNDVSEIDWSFVYSSSDVNVAVSHFNSKLRESIDNYAPFIEKRVKGRECNWLNAEIKTKASYHRNLIEENATNPKKFWNCIKAVFPLKSCWIQTCTSINLNSTVKTFSDYFSGAVKKLKSLTYPLENFTWRYIRTLPRRTNEHFTFDYISRRFVLKELKALKRQKAPWSA